MKMEAEALERLREAESIFGSTVCHTFLEDLETGTQSRREWLKSTRGILTANGVEPENLEGRWRT